MGERLNRTLRLSRHKFRKWFDAFSDWVDSNTYTKMKYGQWRTLNVWSREENGWDEFIIDYLFSQNLILVYPFDMDKITPNSEPFNIDDMSFGTYLGDMLNDYDIEEYAYSGSPCDISTSICDVKCSIDKMISTINDNMSMLNDNKENEEMMKFDFGPVDSSVHMSMYGMAIKNASGNYVAYDAANKQIMDVDIFNFEGANKFIYKMPAALSQIEAGDVVIHARKPMFVQEVRADNRLCVMDIFDGEEKVIVPATSPFGFEFITKVVNLMGNAMNGSANAENPFGNMWMLMAMSGNTKMDDMLPLALMAGGNMDISNPMMMWALMGNRTNDPMMLAMAMGAFNAPKTSCSCGCGCSCEKDK